MVLNNLRSSWVWFWIGLLVLAPVHLGFIAGNPWFMKPPKPVGDGPDYENIAYQLSIGNGWSMDWTDPNWRKPYVDASTDEISYASQLTRSDGFSPTTARPPLLPTLIAFEYCVLPRGSVAFAGVRIFLALCLAVSGAIAVAISVRLMSCLTAMQWPVWMAGLLTLFLAGMDRTARTYATDFLTEPLAMMLVQLLILILADLLEFDRGTDRAEPANTGQRARALATLAGILLGLLIFTRSMVVFWLPLVWIWTAIGHRLGRSSWRQCWPQATRMILVCLLVCTPWWIRNCWVTGTWMPLGTQGPISLLGGYSDDALRAHGEWQVAPEQRLRAKMQPASSHPTEPAKILQREVDVARQASREIRGWAAEHLADLPVLGLQRLQTEWNPYSGRALLWKIAALFGLIFLACHRPRAAWLLGGLLAINSICVMALYSVGGRFLVPTYGLLYTLAGVGGAAIFPLVNWFRFGRKQPAKAVG